MVSRENPGPFAPHGKAPCSGWVRSDRRRPSFHPSPLPDATSAELLIKCRPCKRIPERGTVRQGHPFRSTGGGSMKHLSKFPWFYSRRARTFSTRTTSRVYSPSLSCRTKYVLGKPRGSNSCALFGGFGLTSITWITLATFAVLPSRLTVYLTSH